MIALSFLGFNLLLEIWDLRNMGNKNDDIYLSKFIFYLFNYKAWFKNKKGRRNKSCNEIDTSINK